MVQKNRYDHGLNGAVAAVIRGERAMADLTIQQLADRAGVNSQTLRRYLATERAFDIETLDDVARALGLSAAAVMVRAQERVAQSATQAASAAQAGNQTGSQTGSRVYDAVRGEAPLSRQKPPTKKAVKKAASQSASRRTSKGEGVKKLTRPA